MFLLMVMAAVTTVGLVCARLGNRLSRQMDLGSAPVVGLGARDLYVHSVVMRPVRVPRLSHGRS
jgi:hypothetical protein